MKDKKAFLWATIGGIVVAILLPFIAVAVQTYVIPTGTTGQRTEMLTNAPNRDEALRSSFSGAAAPTSPTPLAGQMWMDTTNDRLTVRNAAGTDWNRVLLGASTAVSCAAGYTEVRGWCMDTDGSLPVMRSVTASEGAYVASVVNASAKKVMLRTYTSLIQDGVGETAYVVACSIPGDSSITSCDLLDPQVVSAARANLANEGDLSLGHSVIRADSSGQVKTRCIAVGTVTGLACTWHIEGYMP